MKIIKKTLFIFLSAAPVSFCAVFCCCSLKEQNGGDANMYIDGLGNISADFTARGNISLYVDKTPGFNDSDVTKCFDDVKAHYDALNEKTTVSAPVAMVILSDENILSRYVLAEKGGAVLNDGWIICSLSGFENKGYLPALAGACLNTTESRKQTAAADYFFKTPNSSDLSALKDYYEDKNHHLALTLFEGYFCKAFASENDNGIAFKTAVCFGRYIIDNYGISALCNASLTDYRGEWLAALGIKNPFTIEYDLSWLNGARYSVKFFSYPLVIETADRVFYPDSVKTDRESSSFYTPERFCGICRKAYGERSK